MTRRVSRKERLARLTVGTVASSIAVSLTPTALALSFGGEQVISFLGQPLRVAIPLLGATAEPLEERCFRVLSPNRSDGLAVVSQARVELQASSNPPRLIIRTGRPVDDPIVHLTIESACDSPVRRDYTILLDPPPSQGVDNASNRLPSTATPPPSDSATASTAVAPVGAAAVSANTSAGAGRVSRSAADRAARSANAPEKSSSRTPKSAANPEKSLRIAPKPSPLQQDRLRVQDGSGEAFAAAGDPSLAALAVPRLKIASDLPSFEPPPAGSIRVTDELQAAIASDRRARLLNAPLETDLSPRLEADLVVATRRLAELQSQLTAAGLTPKSSATSASGSAAGIPSEAAVAKVDSQAATPQSGWSWRDWLWIPGVLLVLGLLAFLLRQKSAQRKAESFAAVASPTITDEDDRFEPTRPVFDVDAPQTTLLGPTTAVLPVATPSQPPAQAVPNPLLRTPTVATAEREASDRLNNPLFQLRDTTRHVDVSELSQVTDEAQVYVDLGRSDQAIEILRDHIAQQEGERDSPAAWLMIFDLYRRTNNRAGYDELAPKFRTHFNGRMPDWDNYGHELALDDGLEAFPHLVAVLQRDWGTPEARKFLEELLYDNRGGSRLGFSLAAYRDILLLMQVHDAFDGEPQRFAAMDWESRGANDDDGTPKWDLSLEMLEPPKVGELESFLRNRPPEDRS